MKRIIFSITLLLALSSIIYAFRQEQQRYYFVQIPDRLAEPFLRLVNGNIDVVSAKDADEIRAIVINQLSYQARQYQVQDSLKIAQDSTKKDTLKKKDK